MSRRDRWVEAGIWDGLDLRNSRIYVKLLWVSSILIPVIPLPSILTVNPSIPELKTTPLTTSPSLNLLT